MLKKYEEKEKTGMSETLEGIALGGIAVGAIAQFVENGALGVLPFFDVVVTNQQAASLGLFSANLIAWLARQYYKAKND